MNKLETTPLTQWHRDSGAKMGPFAGYDMPIQYEGILVEHKHTRSMASLFDICHMGEFILTGPGAAEALDRAVSHNLSTLAPGKCRYGFLLNEHGGIIDDLIIYRREKDSFFLVVNAARREIDFRTIQSRLGKDLDFKDISDSTAKIDLQGPKSLEVLNSALSKSYSDLKYFNFIDTEFNGTPMMVSRTGYTGELGYELYLDNSKALELWETLMKHELVKPGGLGARDTIRLELGYPLYGQDLDENHTPLEAGYGFMLKKDSEYAGKSGLVDPKDMLIPLTIQGRRSARHGDQVLFDGQVVGEVTSGSFAPSLGHCVALAYVRADVADNAEFEVKAARTELKAIKASLPFYTEGTARTKI